MNITPYLTPQGKREALLRLSLILLSKSAKPDEFLKLERKLAAELSKHWRKKYSNALKSIFESIPDYLSKEAIELIEDGLIDALGSSFGSSDDIRKQINDFITEAYSKAKKEYIEKAELSLPDRRAINVLTRHNCFWIGEHYGKHVGPKISELTQKALNEGLGRTALAESLRQELGSVAPEGYSYWDVVSSSALVRARSFGVIAGMEEAGITEYEILAVDDWRMCDICGTLSGTHFSVAETREYINHALDITNPEDFKAAMPWQTKAPEVTPETKDKKHIDRIVAASEIRRLTENSQNLPPFHGRCRCIVVMVNSSIISEAKMVEEANELIAGIARTRDFFPELEKLNFVGSWQEQEKFAANVFAPQKFYANPDEMHRLYPACQTRI